MFPHQSANVKYNLSHACDPWHMHQDRKIHCWEQEYVYTHLRLAHLRFRNIELPDFHQLAQVAFRAKVVPVLVEVNPFLCASSISVDPLLCHFDKEGCLAFNFHESLPGVFLSQPSHDYFQETQVREFSLPWLLHKVSWSDIVLCPWWHVNILLWPFWP